MQRDGDKGMTSILMLAGMARMAGWPIPLIGKKLHPIKQMRKCALPGCEVLSVKDYCCADHCRKHHDKAHSL